MITLLFFLYIVIGIVLTYIFLIKSDGLPLMAIPMLIVFWPILIIGFTLFYLVSHELTFKGGKWKIEDRRHLW